MTRRQFIGMVFIIVVVSFLLSMNAGDGTENFNIQFAFVYGWMDYQNVNAMLISFANWIFPQMILILFLGNIAEEQLYSMLPYILTRAENPTKIWRKVYKKVIGISVVASGMFPLSLWSILFVEGMRCSIDREGWSQIICWILYQVLCVLFLNVMAAYMPPIYGIGILLSGEVLLWFLQGMIFGGMFPAVIHKILPISTIWFFDGKEILQSDSTIGLGIFLIIVIVMLVWSIRYTGKRDILSH